MLPWGFSTPTSPFRLSEVRRMNHSPSRKHQLCLLPSVQLPPPAGFTIEIAFQSKQEYNVDKWTSLESFSPGGKEAICEYFSVALTGHPRNSAEIGVRPPAKWTTSPWHGRHIPSEMTQARCKNWVREQTFFPDGLYDGRTEIWGNGFPEGSPDENRGARQGVISYLREHWQHLQVCFCLSSIRAGRNHYQHQMGRGRDPAGSSFKGRLSSSKDQ